MTRYNLKYDNLPTSRRTQLIGSDERLRSLYAATGHTENYTGQFYPGPYKFDVPMQEAAFDWLKKQL